MLWGKTADLNFLVLLSHYLRVVKIPTKNQVSCLEIQLLFILLIFNVLA